MSGEKPIFYVTAYGNTKEIAGIIGEQIVKNGFKVNMVDTEQFYAERIVGLLESSDG